MSHTQNSKGCWPFSPTTLDTADRQVLVDVLLPVFESLLSAEKIQSDPAFAKALHRLYIPFCAWLVERQMAHLHATGRPLLVAINGSQGSGKSTLAKILRVLLEQGFAKKVVSFSIDDLYTRREQRAKMAKDIHPLFATRGVPGTHDIQLGRSLLGHLLDKKPGQIAIPIFDKSIDDRVAQDQWPRVSGDCDIILFEGWCVGSTAEDDQALHTPINDLEKNEDQAGIWREYVNQQLKQDYAELFSLIDVLVMLKIPDFSKVLQWRSLQEQKLKASLDQQGLQDKTMSESEIERFIMHYERITRHTLNEMPNRAHVVFQLADDHRIKDVTVR